MDLVVMRELTGGIYFANALASGGTTATPPSIPAFTAGTKSFELLERAFAIARQRRSGGS